MRERASDVASNHVRHTVTQGVARVVIDRPEKRNALGLQTIEELISAIGRLEADAEVRVIVLTGAGNRVFASGADLDELPAAFDTPESAADYDRQVTTLYTALAQCSKPIIARMAGHAIGGGCLLALACDVRIAVEDIKVAFPVPMIGLMLSPHEHRLILQHMTLSTAKMLMFTGRRILASEAKDLGLLDAVVPATMLDAEVDSVASQIAQGAPLAITAAKRILNAMQSDCDVDEVISAAYQSIYTSSDLREGFAAIQAKRKPIFTGK